MSFWKSLKERKLAQWALAYLAGAWVLLQVITLLGTTYAWPGRLMRAVPVLLAAGFLAALVLAWYHGEEGRQRVSGPELLMLAALLLLAGAAVAWVGGGAERPVAAAERPRAAQVVVEGRSLAVLPFADLSEAGDQKWFADGLAEEILTSLTRLPELRVVGRSSSFRFQDGDAEDAGIAAALGVSHLLKGSVRRAGEQLRVTAQLLRAGDGVQLWSESYDGAAAGLLDVQRDVAEQVAAAAHLAEARRAVGDHAALTRTELRLHLRAGDRDAALSVLERRREPGLLSLALRGDAATALARAREIEAAQDWPETSLLNVYHQLGEVERSRALVRRIDALPSGPAILAVHLHHSGRALTFDLADAPNFTARLREAGADPGSLRTMPRAGALPEGN